VVRNGGGQVTVCRQTDWLAGDRRFPGELRLPGAATVIKVDARTEIKGKTRAETRYYISSAILSAQAAAEAARGHWAIENSIHWVLDVIFKDDLSRVRTGHGAKNMAVIRHFAFNLVRAKIDKHSLKNRRKCAGWGTDYLTSILNMKIPQPGFGALVALQERTIRKEGVIRTLWEAGTPVRKAFLI
jgi:predicted transposase YbfD/YdcC